MGGVRAAGGVTRGYEVVVGCAGGAVVRGAVVVGGVGEVAIRKKSSVTDSLSSSTSSLSLSSP